MPPRVKGGKKGRVAALPPGSELETLAWGHHMEQTAMWKGVAKDIQTFTNNASLGLLSGTSRAEWALYAPTLGVGVPITRAMAIEMTPADMLRSHFDAAEAGRKKGEKQTFNPENKDHINKALRVMTGGENGRYGEGATIVGGRGLAITKAQGLRARLGREGNVPDVPAVPALPAVPAVPAPRAQIGDVPAPVAPRLADTDVDAIIGGILGPPEAPLTQMSQPAQPGARSVLREDLTDLNDFLDNAYDEREPPLDPFA